MPQKFSSIQSQQIINPHEEHHQQKGNFFPQTWQMNSRGFLNLLVFLSTTAPFSMGALPPIFDHSLLNHSKVFQELGLSSDENRCKCPIVFAKVKLAFTRKMSMLTFSLTFLDLFQIFSEKLAGLHE
jgi:hypothetical protein